MDIMTSVIVAKLLLVTPRLTSSDLGSTQNATINFPLKLPHSGVIRR